MEAIELQQQFFNHLKALIPPHLSIVDELAELLNLSYDSVYRRLRGEKPLALHEMRQICSHYHISIDQVLDLHNETVVFHAPSVNQEAIVFLEYLKGMLQQMKYFNSFREKEMLYLCKDLPFWQFYLFPDLAAFKTFFWSKTLLNKSEFNQKQFSFSSISFDEYFQVGQELNKEYNQIPSIELWNRESINSTLSQIEYYRDAGMFQTKEDFERVVDSFLKTLDHLELQAEKGVKFMPGSGEVGYRSSIKFFINEVVLGSNTILAEVDKKKLSFISYNVFSYLSTKDPRFNESTFRAFHNLASRSTLISGTGEKERNKFFNALRSKVAVLRK
jgi:BetR domain-containing protein